MARTLKVTNLSWGTTPEKLRAAFGQFGEVTEARVVTDWETGRSRGFGFVSFSAGSEAEAAIHGLDGQSLDGREIRVEAAPAGASTGAKKVFRSADFDGGGSAGRKRNTYRGEEYADDGRVKRLQQRRGLYRNADFDGSGVPATADAAASPSRPPAKADPPKADAKATEGETAAGEEGDSAASDSTGTAKRGHIGDQGDNRTPFG